MSERPIIFNSEMVRAILDGRKTQTRRVIKPQPVDAREVESEEWPGGYCLYGQIGDRLWVRETFCHKWDNEGPVFNEDGDYDTSCVWYRATTPDVVKLDEDCEEVYLKDGSPASPWMPSIHMPRWASRIQLEITDIRVERVQETSEEDAKAEGCETSLRAYLHGRHRKGDAVPLNGVLEPSYRNTFAGLWNSINVKRGYGWDVNPWVWIVEFKIVEVES